MTATKKAPGGAGTFLRFAWQQFANRKALQDGFRAPSDFAETERRVRADPNGQAVVALKIATTDPWTPVGLTLSKGARFTVFADGTVWISKPLSVGASPQTAVWLRIGKQGPIRKMRRTTMSSFEAWADGELEFCLKPPGEWASENGDFDPTAPRTGATGTVEVLAATWRADADPKFLPPSQQNEAAPNGWSYLWRIGDGSIYGAAEDSGKPCIHVHTHGDVGILQYPIEVPLDDTTTLDWRWLVQRLPSALPEHIQPTHDYLSIAVEFENGQDLTYFWSAELAVDTVFKCPLPWWDKRETHWVVRSGRDGLGQWQSEHRNLKVDYAQAIGGTLPSKVVRIWLIANSVFQRRHGEAKFAGIVLTASGASHRIV